MRILCTLAVAILLSSCTENQKEKESSTLILSGNIENRGDLEVKLYDNYGNPTALEVLDNGTFTDTLSVDNPGYYMLAAGRQRHKFFLSPENTLNIQLDLASQDEIPVYKGSLAASNTYLHKKIATSPAEDFPTFYAGDEASFVKRIDSLRDAQTKTLIASKASDTFKEIEKQSLDLERQQYLQNYPKYHPYFTEDKDYVMSEGFLSEFENFDYDNEKNANLYGVYRNLVLSEFQESYALVDSTFSDFDKILSTIGEKKSPRVRDELLTFASFFFTPDIDNLAQKRDTLLKLATSESLKTSILEKYESIKNLTPGNASPTFTYENYEGGETSLSDLKGKYVYIDVWATWCGPCLGEIPALQKVEEDFKDEDVSFVSISIDEEEDYAKWREMISKKELGGTQLMSDKNWKSDFVTEYAIDGIPRFILLDPEGNIVSANAKRPSDPALSEQLQELIAAGK